MESQEQIATNALVDSLAEQALLESLLEASKPPQPPDTAALHYLLATPFRYPPLRHGSRFGTRFEPSLFYASRDQDSALAETAYYRLVFWSGMASPPPGGRLTTEHTAFGARIDTNKGLQLQAAPFNSYADQLQHPADYVATQQLGQQLREAGIEAFEYRSARDPQQGINIALFQPRAFAAPAPDWQQTWLCETGETGVSFFSKQHGVRQYERGVFLVAGELPVPAV